MLSATAFARETGGISEPRATTRSLVRLLDDLAALLLELPGELYTARPMPGVSGSVGEHVRHILDHVAVLANHRTLAPLTYDKRERGTAVETDASAAVRMIWRLKTALDETEDLNSGQPVLVTSVIDYSGTSVTAWSSLDRELAFVVNHTVHHHALIAVLLSVQGVRSPDYFGHAPSTPRRAVN